MTKEPDSVYDEQKSETIRHFEETFGVLPFWLVVAPARVSLLGEHIDYCDGFVLPIAVNRFVMMAVTPNGTSQANFSSTLFPDSPATIQVDEKLSTGDPAWANYIRGVLDGFREKDLWPLPGFDALIHSTVPVGAGLSSSAALELATATVAESLLGIKIQPKNKALLCQRAEQSFGGVPCGIMDQFITVFAKKDHALLIDCRSQEVQAIPFTDDNIKMIIADTRVRHELSDGAYSNRKKHTQIALSAIGKDSWRDVSFDDLEACKDQISPVVYRRALHIISEISYTQQGALAVARGDMEKLGELMTASHASLRDNYGVSCKELDLMVEAALEIGTAGGVLGSRLTGGGFGGSTVTLARADKVDDIIKSMRDYYQKATGIEPEIFYSPSSDGVWVEEL